MPRVITVKLLWDTPTYDSAIAAVAAASCTDRCRKSVDDSKHLRRAVIQSGGWSETSFWLFLSTGRSLRVRLGPGRVDWSVQNDMQQEELPPVIDEPLVLSHEKADEAWDRGQILRDRIGKKLEKVYAGEAWIWLYVEGCEKLWFARMLNVHTGQPFLYWNESQ